MPRKKAAKKTTPRATARPKPEPAVEVSIVEHILAERPADEAPPLEVIEVDEGAEAGYAYPEGAFGKVKTLRDYGSMRVAQDSVGRKFRQYKE